MPGADGANEMLVPAAGAAAVVAELVVVAAVVEEEADAVGHGSFVMGGSERWAAAVAVVADLAQPEVLQMVAAMAGLVEAVAVAALTEFVLEIVAAVALAAGFGHGMD